ncbi:MAG: ABC transporter substrate-binding protein [Acidobacteriota bacterium]
MLRQTFLSLAIFTILIIVFSGSSCNRTNSGAVTIANSDKFSSLDTLSTTSPDSAADRLRNLIFNSLVKKSDKFEYIGDLAKEIKFGEDNLTVTFNLQENVKFHNGQPFSSADAKYTLDALLEAKGYKGTAFYDSKPNPEDLKNPIKEPHITSIETPDAKTLVIKVRRPALVNQLLSNLVAIPIIPNNTIEQQKTSPIGTGAFKFGKFDQLNNIVELDAFPEYWEGTPKIGKLVVKTVTDANALQAELQSGRIDIVPNPTNFSADTFNSVAQNPNLQVVQTNGANIRYMSFNVSNETLKNPKLRQAVAFAIDREKIIKELLSGQAKIAHSVLPEDSWAYSAGTSYTYDPAKAKKLIQESGYKGEKINFKIAAGSTAISQYSQVIQNSLKEVGINAEIETLELNTLLDQLKQGQFQMTTAQWVGGNQDPIFLRDLFESNESPDKKAGGRNRSRYSNPEFDKIVNEAFNTVDKAKAKELYVKAQEIISNDLPYITLWYPSNMVVATKRIGNIKINPSGEWTFIKDLTLN